jgi:hypothetical protein
MRMILLHMMFCCSQVRRLPAVLHAADAAVASAAAAAAAASACVPRSCSGWLHPVFTLSDAFLLRSSGLDALVRERPTCSQCAAPPPPSLSEIGHSVYICHVCADNCNDVIKGVFVAAVCQKLLCCLPGCVRC